MYPYDFRDAVKKKVKVNTFDCKTVDVGNISVGGWYSVDERFLRGSFGNWQDLRCM